MINTKVRLVIIITFKRLTLKERMMMIGTIKKIIPGKTVKPRINKAVMIAIASIENKISFFIKSLSDFQLV